MRCIAGLARPTAGSATVLDVPYRDLDVPMRRVGVLIDPRSRHPGRTARAHLVALARWSVVVWAVSAVLLERRDV
jgi:ABC-2 type transport system ATP-binding protein